MSKLIRRWLESLPRLSHVLVAFLPRARPHVPALAAALGLGAITALSEVLRPWPIQVVFDHVLMVSKHPRSHGPIDAWIAPLLFHASPMQIVIGSGAAVLLIVAIGGMADYVQTMLLSEVGQRLVARLRRDLFRHLMDLPPMYHQSRRQGDLLMRLTGDIVLLRELLVSGLTDAASALLVLTGTLAMMFWLEPRLTLVSLAIVPLIAWTGTVVGRKIRSTVRRNRDREGAVAGTAGEALGAIGVLQAFGATSRVAELFERSNRSSLRSGLKASRLEALFARSLDLLVAAGMGVTLALGSASVLHGEMTPGGLLVFVAYQRTLYRPVRQLAKLAARAAKSTACGERVLEVLHTEPEIGDAPDAIPAPAIRGDVTLENLSMQYPRGDVALDSVSLHVPAGQVAVIRGESGAGKSTLLALLPRLLDPTSGVVRIDGTDIRRWTLTSLRANVAIVFQESLLFGLSVRDNIQMGRPDASDDEVVEAAERAGVMRFAGELPHGLDTVVGERGAQLSGGQRQRVALARAALRDARILVLDEPFAHLDESSRDHVLAALRRIAVDRTVILVTHQDHPGLEADLTFTLAGGRLVDVRQAGAARRAAEPAVEVAS